MINASELQAMRDALLRAIYSGTRVVQFSDGRRVEYNTIDEMRQALSELDKEIASGSAPSSFSLATHSRD